MRNWIRNNVLGLVAIFIALGGTTYAANKVESGDIEKNAVKSKHIAPDKVKGGDVDESTLGDVPSATSADRAVRADDAALLDGTDSSGFLRNEANVIDGGAVRDETLSGADIDEASLSGVLGCGSGLTRIEDVCAESSERAPQPWHTAAIRCAEAGLRLPSPAEALLVALAEAGPSADFATWTTDTWGDSANPNGYAAVSNEFGTFFSHVPVGTPARFRCVTSPTD